MTDGSSQTPPPPPPPNQGQQTPPPPPGQSPPPEPAAATYTPGGAAQKKGLSPLAWVGIGCGVVVLIGVIVLIAGGLWVGGKVKDFSDNPEMSTAKTIVRVNPELELVESDDEEGTLTVRNVKTGEVVTVDVSEIKDGRLSFRDEEGQETRIGMEDGEDGEGAFTVRDSEGNETFRLGAGGEENIPGWVPRYPDAPIQGTMANRRGGEVQGGFSFETDDSLEDVLDYYADEMADAGMEQTGRSDNQAGDTRLVNVTYEGNGRTVSTMVTTEGGTTRTVVSYSGEDS